MEWCHLHLGRVFPPHLNFSGNTFIDLPVREQIGRFKYTEPDKVKEAFGQVMAELDKELNDAKQTKEDF